MNFNNMPQSFINIFGIKSDIRTEIHIFGTQELEKLYYHTSQASSHSKRMWK